MRKIVLALASEMISEAYKEGLEDNLERSGFQTFPVEDGEKALEIIKKELPDLVIADTHLSTIGGLDLLRRLKEDESTKKIPVMIFSKIGREEDHEQSLELMAIDFVVGFRSSPRDIAAKVRSYFGEQKRYVINVSAESAAIKNLAKDTGYGEALKCVSCGSSLSLQLLRDLKAGEKHFTVSFFCEQCQSK